MSTQETFEDLPSVETARTSFDDAQLIEFIVQRFHERHRVQLQELIDLASRVEEFHGDHELCPKGLAMYLSIMRQELEQHMYKEEMVLFPMIRAGQGDMAYGPISMMRAEHEEHAQAIKGLEDRVNHLQLPDNACETWRSLYRGIEELISDLHTHMELENDVLFARQHQ